MTAAGQRREGEEWRDTLRYALGQNSPVQERAKNEKKRVSAMGAIVLRPYKTEIGRPPKAKMARQARRYKN